MADKLIKEIIKNNIEQLTIESKISNRKLSENIDASSNYIQKIMEERITPTPEKLMDIANYFKVPIGYLFREKHTPIEDITDYLIELDEKDLDTILTLVKHFHHNNKKS